MRTAWKLMTALVAAIAMWACSAHPGEDADFHGLSDKGWAYGDTLLFTPELADSISRGRVAVVVRHSSAYIFGNLWLEMTMPPAPGDTVPTVDTINVTLADDYGKWLGRGSGVSYVKIDTLPGSYVIERDKPVAIRHIMRVDTVADIEQVGIIFIKQ